MCENERKCLRKTGFWFRGHTQRRRLFQAEKRKRESSKSEGKKRAPAPGSAAVERRKEAELKSCRGQREREGRKLREKKRPVTKKEGNECFVIQEKLQH